MSIRILLADDQALVRRGLRLLLDSAPNLEVVSEVADGEAVFEALAENAIDVLVCDVRMPRLGGLEVLQRLRRGANRLPVVLITTFHDDAVADQAMQAGANAFLLKDAEEEEFFAAIDAAQRGERYLSPGSVTGVRSSLGEDEGSDLLEALTTREQEILRLIAAGRSNKAIGEALFLAEGTVKNRMSVILAKLHVNDRTQAVLKAIRLGLI